MVSCQSPPGAPAPRRPAVAYDAEVAVPEATSPSAPPEWWLAAFAPPPAPRPDPPAPIRLTTPDGNALALESFHSETVVEGPLAYTELRLAFRNPEARVVEGRFTLALPPGAALARLAMEIDGRWQEGEVLERRQARLDIPLATEPSRRFVLSWESDANDLDLHVYDEAGGHASYLQPQLASGGKLLADVTTGYGPELFAATGAAALGRRYRLEAHHFAQGPMGFGMGRVEIVDHDGRGHLAIEERPFVIMTNRGRLKLGEVAPRTGWADAR